MVRHPESGKLYVNFDTMILELIVEARYLFKLNLEIPESARVLCKMEDDIKEDHIR